MDININTTYNIGEKVWYKNQYNFGKRICSYSIEKVEIHDIYVEFRGGEPKVSYLFYHNAGPLERVAEIYLFKTLDDVFDSIKAEENANE